MRLPRVSAIIRLGWLSTAAEGGRKTELNNDVRLLLHHQHASKLVVLAEG